MAAIGFYAVLDGFDLGVGAMHLFIRKDEHRRVFLNAIGPVWDANEVWLVIVAGALFAGFPAAYATLFSALYTPLIGLICGLIFRAVAIEFRSKHESKLWRGSWDVLFCLASIIIAIGVGVVLGNFIHGIPLNENHDYQGGAIVDFLHPYTLLVGLLSLATFMMHGSIFLVLKTEGELQETLRRWVPRTIVFFLFAYVLTTFATVIFREHMVNRLREHPWLLLIVLASVVSIGAVPYCMHRREHGWAFFFSSMTIAWLLCLFAIGTFPVLVRSTVQPAVNSLDIFNSAASPKTLTVLAVIVAIGIPLVIAYGFYLYRIFRGKVKLDHMSY